MKRSEHDDETPPLYEVEVVPVERRLNHPDRRAVALRKAAAAAKRAKTKKQMEIERRRHPGRRATDPKPKARAKKS